jgi:prepilin-type N-terminal cleavage/methylation domain-containing protein
MEKRVFELVNKRAVKNKTKFHTGGEAMERKGFTLIELMIVIAIIIILAAIAIPNYLRMTERAKVSAIESDMKAIGTALEAYNTDWTAYPNNNGSADWGLCKGELLGFDGSKLPDGSSLPAGLTASAAVLNKDPNKTVTGEKAPITYIKPEALLAFETKVGTATNTNNKIDYTSDGGKYTLTVTTKIGSKTYTFTMTPGGQITVSST